MGDFTFDDRSASGFGLLVSAVDVYNGAARKYEEYKVLGYSGTFKQSYDQFENVKRSYNIAIPDSCNGDVVASSLAELTHYLRTWLLSPQGYKELTDTYEPGILRFACFSGSFEAVIGSLLKYGTATITFDCKPQRYDALSYYNDVAITSTHKSVQNTTFFPICPLYRFEFGGAEDINLFVSTNFGTSGQIIVDESEAAAVEQGIVYYDSQLDIAYYGNGAIATAAVTTFGDVTVPPWATAEIWQLSQNYVTIRKREWNI